jgi:OOP family OmpA-OmpF porin
MTPTETEGPGSVDVDIWTVSVGALRHFQPEARLNPYLSFGAGIMAYQVDGPDDEDPFGYWGGGLNYSLSDTTDFRVDLRHILDYRSDNNFNTSGGSDWRHHLQAMLGLTYQFGGQPAPMAKPAPAPAPVAQPVDSDKDGVFDPQDQCPGTAPGVRVDSVGCPADTDGDGVADYLDACVDTPQGTQVDKHGCPKGVKEVASLTLNILFGVDKAEVTPFHSNDLNKAAAFIKKYPMYKVVVEGHTDAQGSDVYNQELSQHRAESVRDALVNKYGFPASQVSATGYGEGQPVADNASKEGRAKNRRVEISIRP